jgi:moderate conductance mechanosensitive channel
VVFVQPPYLTLGPEGLLQAVTDWFSRHAESLVTTPLQIALVVAIAVVLRLLARRFINRAVQRMVEAPTKSSRRRGGQSMDATQGRLRERRSQRAQTIGSVLRSAATIVIFSVAAVVALGEIGIDIAPIIASAGIIGLAFGFGAQSLVSDFLAGLFMLMEDQYGVGDWIDVDGTQGTVEEVGLRVTKLRDMDGAAWYVRNGQVLKIGNYSQDWACAVLDVPVGYDQDVEAASRLLEQAAWSLWDDPAWREYVLDAPQIWGITSLAREALVLRLSVNTVPLQQWGVGRELRRRVKESFDQENIAIPHLSQQVWKAPGEAEEIRAATPSGQRRSDDA